MTAQRRHAAFLASVTDVAEARLATRAGADIIDCKDPLSGVLGALPHAVVRDIRAAVPRYIPVSATIGDLVDKPESIASAVADMAATGVDYVKVGLFPSVAWAPTLERLGALDLGTSRIVGVMLADRDPDFRLIRAMAGANFAGAMLDTAGKGGGTLLDCLPAVRLEHFIGAAHAAGLFAGLAGSLRVCQIEGLMTLEPDVLGFRGALCHRSQRQGCLDAAALDAVRRAIPRPAHGATQDGSGREVISA